MTRNNYAVYVDLESDLTRRLLLGLAGRFEDYNDFGSTTTGKVTARYRVTAAAGAARRGEHGVPGAIARTVVLLVHRDEPRDGQFLEILTLPGQHGRR